MSLATPEKIRTLQKKLYLKAKAEPDYRFYLLYDKIYREDMSERGYRLVRANQGAPGVDGQNFAMIEAVRLDRWLAGLREELRNKTYKPQPLRRVLVPKPGGGEQPPGIPTILDRVVQAAAKLVLEPICEGDLDPAACGYRPKRSTTDAVKQVHALFCQGYTEVVDADLSQYFDTIPHRELICSVARRISDRRMLRLVKMWLKTPVEQVDDQGNRHLTGGKGSNRGTPQGGVIGPLLANIDMNRFLKYWRHTRQGEQFRARVVSFADDFVVLSRGYAKEALTWIHGVMGKLGLTLNEVKTRLKAARREKFDFLGYTFGPHYYRKNGRWYLGASPSKKSVARLKGKIRAFLQPCNAGAWPEVQYRLNALIRGWSTYFSYGTWLMAYHAIDNFVAARVCRFLRCRHKVPTRGTRRFPADTIFGEFGVIHLRQVHLGSLPCIVR